MLRSVTTSARLVALAVSLLMVAVVPSNSTPAAGSEQSLSLSLSNGGAWVTLPAPRQATPPTSVDQALITGLDGVVALSPPQTCLRVDISRATVFRHQAELPLIPASTQKIFVGQVALDRLGHEHRFHTSLVGPTPVDGVVHGDLTLVGGGDPLLSTAAYAFTRRTADQPLTFLDGLADALVSAGVRSVTGKLLADDSRFDALRTVPSWPERYVSQGQVGPLGALMVDDGFRLELPVPGGSGETIRRRVDDPAVHAAEQLNSLLVTRGVSVAGGVGRGTAGVGVGELAGIDSAPLGEVVRQMLEESDNTTAEILTKEIGTRAGTGGSTESGTRAIMTRLGELTQASPGTSMADGSGLDRGNRSTCDDLVNSLSGTGGPDGAIGSRLPVAGRSGTLRDRFLGTAAQGRLRAKTGTLNAVTALAGFVTLPDGRTATFAYIANGEQAEDPRRGQDFLGVLLGQYEETCVDEEVLPVVAPVNAYLISAGMTSAATAALAWEPIVTASLAAFEAQPESAVSACTARAEGFELVLLSSVVPASRPR